ncbi:MAG: hypothetical protein ACJ8IK_09385 [Burkholderiaceae bacterium]|jgi:hypothetical protein
MDTGYTVPYAKAPKLHSVQSSQHREDALSDHRVTGLASSMARRGLPAVQSKVPRMVRFDCSCGADSTTLNTRVAGAVGVAAACVASHSSFRPDIVFASCRRPAWECLLAVCERAIHTAPRIPFILRANAEAM